MWSSCRRGRGPSIARIDTADGPCQHAAAGAAVVLTLRDEIDIARGDLIVPLRNRPALTSQLDAYLCWMGSEPLALDRTYLLRHLTRETPARIDRVEYRVNVDTLHREPIDTLALNEIGRVQVTMSHALGVDSSRVNAATGSFILVDLQTHTTVAAGLIRGALVPEKGRATSRGGGDRPMSLVTRSEREFRHGHQAAVVWLTGLSGAGKTTIARLVERRLFDRGCHVVTLDGDHVRQGLCRDLGFSPEDRAENIRRVGEVAALCLDQGAIVLCAFISPDRGDRAAIRALVPEGRFLEVFVQADIETCRARDPKRLYARADAGTLSQFTGVSAPLRATNRARGGPRHGDASRPR